MKKILFLLAFVAGPVFANENNFSTTFDSESGVIVVSTTPSSPTKVFSQGPYGYTKSFIYNPSAYNLYYSTSNVGISTVPISGVGSTSSTPYIPSSATLLLDGVVAPYQGGLYCVVGAPTPQSIVRQRIR